MLGRGGYLFWDTYGSEWQDPDRWLRYSSNHSGMIHVGVILEKIVPVRMCFVFFSLHRMKVIMYPVGCVTGLFRSPLCTAQHQRPCSFSELSLTLIWMILISLTVISDRLLFLGHYVNNYAEPRSTVPRIHTFLGYYFFDVISVCLLFYVHISIFILMSHCLLSRFCFVLCCCIFHLHNDQSIHFYVVVFFFFSSSLVFSPVQTDKKISIEHASHRKFTFSMTSLCFILFVCVCVCLSVCVLVHTVSPNICVRTWRWMRATAFCVELVYPRFVVVSDRVHWRRASPSCLACLWVLLSCLVWHVD